MIARDEVVIAGAGVAASALALTLLARGFRVTMRERPLAASGGAPAFEGIESIGEHGARLFREVGLEGALRRAGAVVVRGFENGWDPAAPTRLLDGHWVHVERASLARASLEEALSRGARLDVTDSATPLPEGTLAADATGRSARWSRPVKRAGSSTATLYRGPGSERALRGRVIGFERGWAYRLSHPTRTTVGVIRPGPAAERALPPEIARALGIDDEGAYSFEACRPAHPQWAEDPIRGACLSIGDAALSYEPLAGQGLRFALASALAAATALTALRDDPESPAAADYYRTFVDAARRRHLAKLDEIRAPIAAPAAISHPREDAFLVFSAETRAAAVNRGGQIAMAEAVVLSDGGMIRYLGDFDVLSLRDLTRAPRRSGDVQRALVGRGVRAEEAPGLVGWCLRHGVLREASARLGEG